MSGSSDNWAAGSSSGPSVIDDGHILLSGGQFFLLVLSTVAFYYAALFISALAVGESTASLLAPLIACRRLCVGMGKAFYRTVRRGGGRGDDGRDVVEIGEGDENNYDGDDMYEHVPNRPSTGAA